MKDYLDQELKEISETWRAKKTEIDAKNAGAYHYDIDKLYEHVLNNENLRILFRHSAFLYRGLHEGGIILYPNEQKLVVEVYKGILKNGYYSRSRDEEKRVGAHLGKAVSRQYYRKLRK